MTRGDVIGLVLSYIYAFGMLTLVEAIGKRLSLPQRITRKIIHILAGMWVWGLVALFDNWYLGVIPFATFILLNYLFYKKQTFHQMDTEKSTLGTVYFAFSITVLFLFLWRTDGTKDQLPIALAATMAMTLGDAAAALIGRAYGKHSFSVWHHQKTWFGSASMFVFSFIAIAVCLFFVPESTLSPQSLVYPFSTVFWVSVAAAVVATVVEAFSPRGLDNLTVPLLTGLFLVLVL